MDYLLYFFLFISLLSNIFLSFLLIKKKKITLSKDARLLLSELSSGSAIIKVDVIDAAGIFYRSSKG